MRTETDILTDVYLYLKDSEFLKAIKGHFYKDSDRPGDSTEEDAVLRLLTPVPNAQIQEVYLNLNVYVSDKKRRNQYIKDSLRMGELLSLL